MYKQNYDLRLDRLAYENVRGLGTDSVEFVGGVTAIVGANGVGKSTLLAAIFSSLSRETPSYMGGGALKIRDCSLKASIQTDGEIAIRQTDYDAVGAASGEESPNPIVTFLNPGLQAAQIVERCAAITDTESLLESGYPYADASPQQLAFTSYVMNKEYTFVRTYEIDDLFEPRREPAGDDVAEEEVDPFPFFVVRSGGANYRTETMGFGEMSILLTLWQLKRLPPNSILLLEEPETFIAPRSQVALMDAVAELSATNHIWTIITTHSSSILSRVPKQHTRLLVRSGALLTLYSSPTDAQLQLVLGAPQPLAGALIVEDRFAREFVRVWLGHAAPDILLNLEIRDVGGVTGIHAALDGTPVLGPWFGVVGLYDGDQRGKQSDRTWPHAFIVGNGAPETLLKERAVQITPCLASRLGRSTSDLRLVLGALEGVDHHDWFHEFEKALGVGYERLLSDLLSCWLELEENQIASMEAVSDLRAAIALSRARPLRGHGSG